MGKYISFTPLVRGPIITQTVNYTGASPSAATTYDGASTLLTITTSNAHGLVAGNPVLVTFSGGNSAWTALTGEYFVNAVLTNTTFNIIPRAASAVETGTIAVASSNNSISLPILIDVDAIFKMDRLTNSVLGIYLAGIHDSNKVIRVVFNSPDPSRETHNFIMNEIAKCGNDAYLSGTPVYEINSLPGGRTCNFIFTNA